MNVKLIGITGGSGSGKSTVVKKISDMSHGVSSYDIKYHIFSPNSIFYYAVNTDLHIFAE